MAEFEIRTLAYGKLLEKVYPMPFWDAPRSAIWISPCRRSPGRCCTSRSRRSR